MLLSRSQYVREGADCWVTFTGTPHLQVTWGLTGGPGVLFFSSEYTDANGIAYAMYRPGASTAGQVATITVSYREI
jgi:hypothetical protein